MIQVQGYFFQSPTIILRINHIQTFIANPIKKGGIFFKVMVGKRPMGLFAGVCEGVVVGVVFGCLS